MKGLEDQASDTSLSWDHSDGGSCSAVLFPDRNIGLETSYCQRAMQNLWELKLKKKALTAF